MKKKDLVFKHSKNDLSSACDDVASVLTFKKQSSITTWAGTGLVDQLIDYLTVHIAGFAEQEEVLHKFEALTLEVLANCTDPELHRILKEQGWTGAHFLLAIEPPFIDAQSCLNALSNYYLKVNSQPALNDIGISADIESHQLDQILPFCPDVLVTYLKRQPISTFSSGPRRLTFRGACMLADISGFSKFSGAMCSKGVSGLDDLREATNGFLGYFVKQVYEYEGDVIAFAGDALICAFRDTADGISESCFRALQCAHVLRQHKTAALSTHIGVSCGEMQIALLGGHNDQWCYVMNGECVSQLAACIEDAGSQEVAITEECYEYAQIHDAHPQTPAAFRNKLLVDSTRKPSGNYLLLTIGVRRTTTPPPPLSPFINEPEHPGHGLVGQGHNHAAVWNHLKHYGHVHEVASDVLVKQRSDHLVDEGLRQAALESLGRSESILSTALEHSADAPNGITQNKEDAATPKPMGGKKKSAVMETYVSPVSSHLSSANQSSATSVTSKMSSIGMKAKLHMVTPAFKMKNSNSSSTLGSGEVTTPKSLASRRLPDIPVVPPPAPTEGSTPTTLNSEESDPVPRLTLRDPAETAAPTVLVADSALSSATTSDNDIICTLPSEKAAISPGIAAGGAGRPPRDRSNSKTYDAEPAVVMHLPPALKRGISRQNTPKGNAHFSSDILKDLRIESIGPEGPPRTEGPPSAQGLSKNYSNRSVNFSNNTSFSDVTEASISRSETPLSPDSIEGALRITRAGAAGVADTASESSRKGSVVPFSVHKPLDGKKRFGSWGVMKNALRRESFREKYKTTEAEFMQTISKFVPRPVLNAVHTECLDLIGELRQVTTMFVGLDSYSAVDNKDPCTLQPFFLMAQTILHESGGFLRQFLVDDKGCVFIAMWGVPSFTYSNNCSRALYCAARILAGTAQLKHKVSIGIATGTVFCGSVGALERRDYAGVGTDVNMAARLMGKAHGRILIDGATYRNLNVESQTLLKQAEEMHLKGMAGPMTPYQYASTALPRITDIDVESNQRSVLRPKMQSALSKLLDTFLNISTDSETLVLLGKKLTVTFIFLFGLPGTGKALAAQFYRNAARLRSINCLHLVAKADSQGIPYGLLRELFLELIGRGNFATLEQKLHVVTKIIDDICDESDTEDDRNSALESLQLVLGIEPEDMVGIRDSIMHRPSSIGETGKQESSTGLATPSSRSTGLMIKQCSSQNRKFDDYTFYNAVAHLLHNTPTVLIIENAHFIDELSWKELFLMQAGDQLDMSVLLTMEVAHIPDGRYQTVDTEALAAAKKRSANVMNQSFSGDYWDAKEGQEALEHSEAAAVGEDYDIIPEEFPTIIQQHSRSASVGAALTPTLTSAPSTMSGVSLEDDPMRGMTIRSHPNEFWCSILDNTSSTVLVMGELNREEVKQEMARVIEPAALTDGLVDLVYNITSGNAYWVKAMTQFIRERGAEAVFNAVSDRRSRQNPLKQLVLVHFETHMPEYQVISKHASIIGVEFDEETLRAIVPPKLKPTLAASLDSLVAKRFLQCLDPQDRTFSFPNQLIQATIYELTPPSDAAHLHLLIAQYIETTYPHELRSHYPTLGYHYKRCPDKRALAFKFELKAADQQVAKGAYSDGLTFLKSAGKLAERDVELDVILEVISRAVDDIKENMGILAPPPTTTLMRLQSFYSGSNNSRTNGFVLRYNALRKLILQKKEKLRKESEKAIASEKSMDKKKQLLEKARLEGKEATLTWQPSYVAGKRDNSGTDSRITKSSGKSSSSGKSDDARDHTEPVSAGCKCTIS